MAIDFQMRKQIVALAFICLMAGQEAAHIRQTTATTAAAALLFSRIRSVKGLRQDFESMTVEVQATGPMSQMADRRGESFLNLTDIDMHDTTHAEIDRVAGLFAPAATQSCNRDMKVTLSDSAILGGQFHDIIVPADQYRDAGEKGLVIALKSVPSGGLSCVEIYSIKCVDGHINWWRERLGCSKIGIDLDLHRDNYIQETTFGSVSLFHYAEVSSYGSESIVASRFVPQFPAWTSNIKVRVSNALSCEELIRQARDAEQVFVNMLGGLCEPVEDPSDTANVARGCFMDPEKTPSLQDFAKQLNMYMSSNKAARSCSDGSGGKEALIASPVIKTIKQVFSSMMSSKISLVDSILEDSIEALTVDVESCSLGSSCMPSEDKVTQLLADLYYGPDEAGDAQKYAEVGSHDAKDILSSEVAESVELAVRSAAVANETTSSLFQRDGSLLQLNSQVQGGMSWILWGLGIAVVLLFLFLVVSLVCAIVLFVVANVWTILAVLSFGFLIIYCMMKVLCGRAGISNEDFSCHGSRSHYTAKADRLGIPRYLVGKI